MKVVILNTDYQAFLSELYEAQPGLETLSYVEQLRARNESLFGVADFYSANLRALGHEAEEIHTNIEPLQRAWAREHGFAVPADSLPARTLPARALRRVRGGNRTWFNHILVEQVRRARPDVLLIHDMISIDPTFLRQLKPHAGLLVGQHAATRLPHAPRELAIYDLVVSSFEPTVEELRRQGIDAELNRLGFEPRVLNAIGPSPGPRYDVSFVGSLLPGIHDSRRRLLELLCERFETMCVFSPDISSLPTESSIRLRYAGPAWGRGMYEVLRDSRVTINEHGDIAEYANNCRLYEATGVGTLLVTDWKPNLGELFEPGREIVAYRSPEECVDLIEHFLERDEERAAIAAAGQSRTLREHTYLRRVEELVELLGAHSPQRAAD